VIIITLLVLVAGLIYAWRALGFFVRQRAGLWRLACVIGAVRISVFGIGVLFMRSADWRQGLGYNLSLVGLPEIYAAKALRFQPVSWLVASCSLLAASSFLWAALFRLPYRSPAAQTGEPRKN
jgi:hypothetical protein